MFVSIDTVDFKTAINVATERTIQSILRNNKDSLSKKNWIDNLTTHIVGCIGEIAVAKGLGIQWDRSVGTYKNQADLGSNIEARHRSNPGFQLIVREDDKDSSVYILSRGMPPDRVEVVGWIKGSDAKRPEYLKDYGSYGRPAYFVPDDKLLPIENLEIFR